MSLINNGLTRRNLMGLFLAVLSLGGGGMLGNAFGQAGRVDPSFNASLGLAGSIFAVATQPDDKVLIGGFFDGRIVRLGANGQLDPGFRATVVADAVYTLTVQTDGKILAGGTFPDGSSTTNIIRLNPDGSTDAGFHSGLGTDHQILLSAVQPDGHVVVSGLMPVAGSTQTHLFVARLSANGALDDGFQDDLGVGSAGKILALTVQADGKVLVGGFYNSVNGLARNGIVRLNSDGSVDASFTPDATILFATAFGVQPDRKILVGGVLASGAEPDGVVRLNADGSLDASFQRGDGADDNIRSLAEQADGKVVIGGLFNHVDGETCTHLARLNADGTLDTGFNAGGDLETVDAVFLQPAAGILVLANHSISRRNTDGSSDASFAADVTPGLNGLVNASILQASGKLIIGGEFTAVSNTTRRRFGRLNADGTLDEGYAVGAGADGSVESLVLQADGKVLVGGFFDSFDGATRHGLARVKTDGALDTAFDPGADMQFDAMALARQADGGVFVGGIIKNSVTSLNANLVRLNADGSLDASFQATFQNNGGGAVAIRALAVQSDGKLVVGGTFTTINATARASIARLNADGTLDNNFNPGAGPNGQVAAVLLQADGKLVITGAFSNVSAVLRPGVARLNPDGSLDAGFDPNPDFNTAKNNSGTALTFRSDGEIFAAGSFVRTPDDAGLTVVLLTTAGRLDTSFDGGIENDSGIATLAADTGGGVFLGGRFTMVRKTVHNYLVHLDAGGQIDAGFVPGEGITGINAVVIQPDDGKVLTGGSFTHIDGAPINALARLNSDSTLDANFLPGFGSGDTVQALALQPDGDVLVAALLADSAIPALASADAAGIGRHTNRLFVTSKIRNPITRCRKSTGKFDANFNAYTDGTTFAIAALAGNASIVGGSFGHVNGQARGNLARLKADGSVDSGFVGSTDGTVRSVSAMVDGRVVVGGEFGNADGVVRQRIARLDAAGRLDTSFDPGAGPNGPVNSVRVLAGGQVLIGGSFTSVGGVARGGIARLLPNGSLDTSFDPGALMRTQSHRFRRPAAESGDVSAATVTTIGVQADNKVILAGLFDALREVTRHNVLRLLANGDLDLGFDPGSGPDAAVNSLQIQPRDGRAVIGGKFSNVDGLQRPGVARLLGDTTSAPTVSFVVPGANGGNKAQLLESSPALKIKVVRTGGDLSQPLTVRYKPKGGNVPGTDYKALSGVVTIPAGVASAKIKVRALDDGVEDGAKTLKLRLLPATDGAYQLGAPAQVKIRILDIPVLR